MLAAFEGMASIAEILARFDVLYTMIEAMCATRMQRRKPKHGCQLQASKRGAHTTIITITRSTHIADDGIPISEL